MVGVTVEYYLPLPPIIVSATGPIAAKVAAECGDLLILPMCDPEHVRTVIDAFRAADGTGKPCGTRIAVCYHEDEARAKEIAFRWWPISANKGKLHWELPSWKHYEQLQQMVMFEKVAEKIVCGPDVERSVAKVMEVQEFGFDRILIHNVEPEKEESLSFARDQLLPVLR